MAILQLTLISLALLLLQSSAQILPQDYNKTWSLPKDNFVIMNENFADPNGSFSFATCSGLLGWYFNIPLDCNVTVHSAAIEDKKPFEKTCSLKVASEGNTTSNVDPILRQFDDEVRLIWFKRKSDKTTIATTVLLTRLFMSNCTSVTSQGVTLPDDIKNSILSTIPTVIYDDGSFDIFLMGRRSCDGCDGLYKASFDPEGVLMNDPISFQSEFSLPLRYIEVKSFGTPANGYAFRGYENGFQFRLVNNDGSTRSQLKTLDIGKTGAHEYVIPSSNAHGLYGFCWKNRDRLGIPSECFQYDASGKVRLNMTRLHLSNIQAVHNLADGGMLLISLDLTDLGRTNLVVKKINVNGTISEPWTLFLFPGPKVQVVNVDETTDELSIQLAYLVYGRTFQIDNLRFVALRRSKKYLEEKWFPKL